MKSPVSLHVVVALCGASLFPRIAAAQPADAPPPEPIPLVEVYGSLIPFLEYGHTTSATPAGRQMPGVNGAANQVATYSGVNLPGRSAMDPSTTNIGFRGGVEVIPNLSVVWQIESSVGIDSSVAGNTFASRNTNLGITGSWGTLFYGNWDPPYSWISKSTMNPIRSGNITDYNAIIDNPGFGISSVTTQAGRAAAPADAAWERRQGNSVQYWTPNISGVVGRLMYSASETTTPTTAMAPSISPTIVSAAVAVDVGPFKLREGIEAHWDYFGMSQIGGSPGATNTNRSATDFGSKTILQYTSPIKGFESRVVGIGEFLSYENKDTMMGANNKYSRFAVYGMLDQALMSKHHVWIGFGKAFEGTCEKVGGATCSTGGLSATDAVIGYVYRASKSFEIWAAAYRISNDFAASYTSSPSLGGTPPAPGTMIEAIGLGLYYTFSAKIIGPAPKAKPAEPPAPTIPTPAPTNEPGPVPPPNAAEPPPNAGTPPPPTPNPNPNP